MQACRRVTACRSSGHQRATSQLTHGDVRKPMSTNGGAGEPTLDRGAEAAPVHVIVLVHGFMGVPSNWDWISGRIEEERRRREKRRRGDSGGEGPASTAAADAEEDMLCLVSKSNSFMRTRDGVDRCARRLVDELKTFVGLHHSRISREGGSISFVGHSFGGLVARYAAALLCEEDGRGASTADRGPTHATGTARTILGLKPRHYLSIASPHAGVGSGQLPFINIGGSRSIGDRLSSLVVSPYVKTIGSRTVKDLFLYDNDATGRGPILQRMATERSFVDALSSFETRTAYINLDNDLMVGFETSALLRDAQRPASGGGEGQGEANGIVREDDRHPGPLSGVHEARAADAQGATDTMYQIIDSLARLNWKRVHVSFAGARIPGLAHTHIQVSRPWLNGAGVDVADHIVATVLRRSDTEAAPPPQAGA